MGLVYFEERTANMVNFVADMMLSDKITLLKKVHKIKRKKEKLLPNMDTHTKKKK